MSTTAANQAVRVTGVQQPSPSASLLDRVIEQQASVASRYQPVMSIDALMEREKAIDYLVTHLMKEGVDYGYVPGTRPNKTAAAGEYAAKPSLFKAGAERACAFFGYAPHYEQVDRISEWTAEKYGEPLFYHEFRCVLSKDRSAIGEGIGAASSWESKYRYRKGQRECPDCGKAGTIIKGKAEYGGGWLCFQKKGGCGAKFKAGDPAIEAQDTDQVCNPDIADVVNVVLKMGQKRAYVAATLTATGLSGRFTQDLEDMPRSEPISEPKVEELTEKDKFLGAIHNRDDMKAAFKQLLDKMVALNPSQGEQCFSRILMTNCKAASVKEMLKSGQLNTASILAALSQMWDWVGLAEAMIPGEGRQKDAFDQHMEETSA